MWYKTKQNTNWLRFLAKKSRFQLTQCRNGYTLWFDCALPRWMELRSHVWIHWTPIADDRRNLSVWLQGIILIQLCYPLFVVGLESHMVHSQPRPDPVFPEHSAGVGAVYLSVAVGAFLLPSPLLPWLRTHSNVLPLLRQDGETSLYCPKLFTQKKNGFNLPQRKS